MPLAIDVGLVTCANFPQLAPDDLPLADALMRRGLCVRPVVWDDPGMDWGAARVCIVRSTWGYHHRLRDFLTWVACVDAATLLWNPASILRWNTHKSYLRDLAALGVPVVPTVWLDRDSSVDLAQLMSSRGWQTIVVKPAVSASAYGTMLIEDGSLAAGQAHLDKLLASVDMMMQPFVPSVDTYGERSLIFIDGEMTHAVRRDSVLKVEPDWSVPHRYVTPSLEEVAVARQALLAVGEPVLYARVDLVQDDTGAPCLLELELVEPMLFLGQAPGAVERMSDAIERLLTNK